MPKLFKHKSPLHRRRVSLLVGLFVVVQVAFGVLSPVPVRALPVNDVNNPVDKALEQVGKALLSAAQNGLVNLASYFMRTIAYDTASYIASGGKGQKSLIFEKGFGEYVKDVASASVGEAIDSLGNQWGVDLCQPPNLNLQAQLKIGLDVTYQDKNGFEKSGPQSKCSFQKLKDNWGNASGPSLSIDSAANFASEVNVTETDFGFALGALERLDALKSTQEKAATLESQVNQGYKAVTDLISGHVNTPAALVKEESTALTGKAEGEKRSQQISGLYASELWQIIPTTASVFLNTLTSQLLNRIFTKGLVPTEKEKGAAFDFYATNSAISKRQIAERAFNFFTATTGKKDSSEYDIALHFASCPDPQNPAADECVMNENMQKALNEARTQPVTLFDAVFTKKYINENTPLISPRNTAANEDGNCYKDKFCYSNIQKMRKARILPLGFEIAALRSNPDRPWTIGEVLKGFEVCTRAADGSIVVSEDTPFCHLINPNWVLRAPQARCENRAYSPDLLTAQSPQRRDECLDVSTCISEDENGNCTTENYYGYCTQEKNVWELPGESCEAQFASCNTYTNQETNSIVSYLSRTLEYGSCSATTVGCAPYVTERVTGTSTWVGTSNAILQNKLSGRDQVLYLNEQISNPGNSCPPGADGCTQFIGAVRNPATAGYVKDINTKLYTQDLTRKVNLRQAPAYLGCYDTNPNTVAIDYPTTAQQIANNIPTDARCDAYAQVCLAEEVGCDLYDPVGPGETVPGVVGDNFCPSSCVGYETFKQDKTAFESAQYPLYFIPANGQQCTFQDVGCDEFTNINDASSGGEQLEYYTQIKRCEVPNGDNSNVYYSWEGTAQNGYTLRVHTLAKVASPSSAFPDYTVGSPAYANESQLSDVFARCNATNYAVRISGVSGSVAPADADCRALYDSNGGTHYRLLAETVTVSAACHPIRKTESRLEPLSSVKNSDGQTVAVSEAMCPTLGGYWNTDLPTPSCQICQGGGKWQVDANDPSNGSCVYYAIDAPGESRSCAPAANGCRAYVGNAGNNTKQIFNPPSDTFEPVGTDAESLIKAKEQWTPSASVTIAGESITVNGHSLGILSGSSHDRISRALPSGAMESGASYELVFWARGTTQSVSISLQQGTSVSSFTYNPLISSETPISIGASWREYRVGPVVFTGNLQDPISLVFDRSTSPQKGAYFIDNVELRRTDGVVPLIKNSWKTAEGNDVPLACDNTPSDGFPGAALGCRAYTTSLNQTVYATGFERLCREKAVGCAPLWDTQGTASQNAEVYNARCVNGSVDNVTGALTRTAVQTGKKCEVAIANVTYSCDIQARESSCIISTPVVVPSPAYLLTPANTSAPVVIRPTESATGYSPNTNTSIAIIDMSSVYVPADTPMDAPLYLTDMPTYACKSEELGCQAVAREEQSLAGTGAVYSYVDQFILNRPSQYLGEQGTLCAQEQVACSAFSTTDGVTRFFKDPAVNANKLCTYLPGDSKQVDSPTGWFIKEAGRCSNNSNTLCTQDTDCGAGNKCDEIGTSVACYPEYFENFSSYGLWSNGSQNYAGFVGECPSGQNLCTEFVDPYDTDTSGKNPKGKPYYIINNDTVTNTGECNGRASLREGCVLFDQTDIPGKTMTASNTYTASEALANKGGGLSLVTPVSTSQNNANVILKVNRNRECTEWLSCTSYEPIKTSDGTNAFACADLGRCIAHDGGVCTAQPSDPNIGTLDQSLLDLDQYVSRDTSWNGVEYTGYSLYNQIQIADLDTVIIKDVAGVDTRNSYVGFVVPTAQPCATEDDGKACGVQAEGRCISQKCIVPRTGTYPVSTQTDPQNFQKEKEMVRIAQSLGPAECKVIPEVDSPFPPSIAPSVGGADVKTFVGAKDATGVVRNLYTKRPGQMNICQGGESCACEYTKISYVGIPAKDYWASGTYRQNATSLGVWGVCSNNFETSGQYCALDSQCGQGGTCNPIEAQQSFVGATGHCLEYDLSRPIAGGVGGKQAYACLTWLPVDRTFGRLDTYNVFMEAGYDPTIDAVSPDGGASGQVYCTESTAFDAGAYEGTLRMHPRYGGNMSQSFSDIVAVENQKVGQLCTQFSGNDNWTSVSTRLYVSEKEVSDAKNADPQVRPPDSLFTTKDGHPALRDYLPPSSCFKGVNDDDYKKHPYTSYVCGTKFSGTNSISNECGNQSLVYTSEDSVNSLYSLMSLWAWKFIGPDASVLRVEADSKSTDYGNDPFVSSNSNHVEITSLLPYPKGLHDTKTLLHPPRFGNDQNSAYSFNQAGRGYQMDTRCHAVGGCPTTGNAKQLLRVTSPEKYITRQTVEQVYFVPLRLPFDKGADPLGGDEDANGIKPGLFSNQLKIDFTMPTSRGANVWGTQDVLKTEINSNYVAVPEYVVNTYVLERGKKSATGKDLPCDGLVSFCDYDTVQYVPEGNQANNNSAVDYQYAGNPADMTDSRNQVYERFVMLAYLDIKGKSPFNLDGTTEFSSPENREQDPFLVNCPEDTKTPDNWLAIGMDFNKDGEFLGYISRMCNPTHGAYGVQLAVIAKMKNQCTEFVSVYRDTDVSNENTNKAWTNKVWKGTSYSLTTVKGTVGVPQQTVRSPFGSVGLTHGDITALSLGGDRRELFTSYAFENKIFGLPLYCRSIGFNNALISQLCEQLKSIGHATSAVDAVSEWSRPGSLVPNGQYVLSRLFASRYGVASFPFSTSTVGVANKPVTDDSYKTDGIYAILHPPQIYSLNPATCFPEENNVRCTVGEKNNFTIGTVNGTPTDYDGKNGPDEGVEGGQIIAYGSYQARALFFAFADDNRMPIRRVMVQWGDGKITNKDTKGFYKNRKQICEQSNTPPPVATLGHCTLPNTVSAQNTGLTCHSTVECPGDYQCTLNGAIIDKTIIDGSGLTYDNYNLNVLDSFEAPRFGNLPRACEEAPFEYYHTYGCEEADAVAINTLYNPTTPNANMLTLATYNRLMSGGQTPADKVCVYRPAVQVLDNWGWCNGTNQNGDSVGYNNEFSLCDSRNSNVWTYYQGLIVVVP